MKSDWVSSGKLNNFVQKSIESLKERETDQWFKLVLGLRNLLKFTGLDYFDMLYDEMKDSIKNPKEMEEDKWFKLVLELIKDKKPNDISLKLLKDLMKGDLGVIKWKLVEQYEILFALIENPKTFEVNDLSTFSFIDRSEANLREIYVNLKEKKEISYRRTPLHCAVEAESLEMVKELVEEYGAKTDVLDSDKRTPLWRAAMRGNHDTFVYLFEKGAPRTDNFPLDSHRKPVLIDPGPELLPPPRRLHECF